MINIKDKNAIEKMTIAGKLLAEMLESVKKILTPSISTLGIDSWVEKYLDDNNLISCTKGYMGYRHSSCISVNDEVVHGVPNANNKLKSGNLVKIDVCASYKGYCADMARCFFVDEENTEIKTEIKDLVKVSQKALDRGISKARSGNRLTDISFAIQSEIEKFGYGIVREFAGHGIGAKMHESPEILNFGKPGCGPLIRPGMAFAIEPMVTMGKHNIYITKDGWTVKTVDGSLAAHVEDTVIITDQGPKIITRL